MTRDEFKQGINSLASHLTYPILDTLHVIDDHDAEQRQVIDEQVEENRGLRSDVLLMQKVNADRRAEIERLQEWQRIILGTGTDQEAVIRMAAPEYTKVAIQLWKEAHEKQRQEIARLRDVLYGIIVNCEGSDDAVLLKMQMRAFALNALEQKEST